MLVHRQFNRKKILLVPSTPEKRLGLLTVGGEVLTVWTLAADDVWTRRTTMETAELAYSAGVSPLLRHSKPTRMLLELECCSERSGTVLLKITGRVEAIVLSLETMQAKLAFLKHKDLSIVCPYETMDFAACIPAMNQF